MKRISVIINLYEEAEGVLNALINPKLRPSALNFPDTINTPKDYGNKMNAPRAVYYLGKNTSTPIQVTVRCIDDLTSPANNIHSSEEKYRVLVPMLAADNPDLVISISTANYPLMESLNGSVIIGGNFFLFNGHPNNPKSNLKTKYYDQLLSGNANPDIFKLIDQAFVEEVVKNFITPPNNPAKKLTCMASVDYSVISSTNVTDCSEYDKGVDRNALARFHEIVPSASANAIETTHGVVKISTSCPVVFIAPIVDRLGHFDEDVNALQSYVSSFNSGIVLGYFLCALSNFVNAGNSFEKSNIACCDMATAN